MLSTLIFNRVSKAETEWFCNAGTQPTPECYAAAHNNDDFRFYIPEKATDDHDINGYYAAAGWADSDCFKGQTEANKQINGQWLCNQLLDLPAYHRKKGADGLDIRKFKAIFFVKNDGPFCVYDPTYEGVTVDSDGNDIDQFPTTEQDFTTLYNCWERGNENGEANSPCKGKSCTPEMCTTIKIEPGCTGNEVRRDAFCAGALHKMSFTDTRQSDNVFMYSDDPDQSMGAICNKGSFSQEAEPTTEDPDVPTEDPDVTTEEAEPTTEDPDVTTEDPDVTTEDPDVTTVSTTKDPEDKNTTTANSISAIMFCLFSMISIFF